MVAIDEAAMNTLKQVDVAKGNDVEAKAQSSILLSMGDEVLREVFTETQTIGVWEKLQVLYMKLVHLLLHSTHSSTFVLAVYDLLEGRITLLVIRA